MYQNPITNYERDALGTAASLINAFRAIDPRMPSSYMSAFLAVAMNPGEGPTQYARAMGTIQPIASRILQEIGQRARHGDEPLQLVDQRLSTQDARQRQYFLTTKGELLKRRILG